MKTYRGTLMVFTALAAFCLISNFAFGQDSLYINPNGNVGIGTTNPQYGKLEINGEGNLGGVTIYTGTGGTGATFRFYIANDMGFITRGGAYKKGIAITNSDDVGIGEINPQYKLDVSGTIRGSNVSPSDARLKKDVMTLDNALDLITKLRGVKFRWKEESSGDGIHLGVIAQEVEKIFPEIVSTDSEGYRSIAYEKLVAPLIEAVKSLKQKMKCCNKG